jgi:hypothetical protein
MRNITTWIERKFWHLILGYKNYKQNTSWVYHGVGAICVLLYMLSSKSKLDDRGVGSTRSRGFHELLQGLKLTLKSHFERLFWGMTSGHMLEVRFMIDSNYLQCIPRNTLTHDEKPTFVYSTKLPQHWLGQWQ